MAAVAPAPVAEPKPVKTPAVMADERLENFYADAQYTVTRGKEISEKFAADFLKNPAHALEWSRETFVWAGRNTVAGWMIGVIDFLRTNGDDYTTRTSRQILNALVSELKRSVLCEARSSTSCSTSPTSNYMTACLTAARAEMLERLERSLDFIDRVDS